MEYSGANARIAKLEVCVAFFFCVWLCRCLSSSICKKKHTRELASYRQAIIDQVADSVREERGKMREKQILMMRAAILSILNQDPDPMTKRWTSWSRRSKALQQEVDKMKTQLLN